jgi:hemolysin activation/secretion protein
LRDSWYNRCCGALLCTGLAMQATRADDAHPAAVTPPRAAVAAAPSAAQVDLGAPGAVRPGVLTGLRFLADPAQLQAQGVTGAGIDVSAVPMLQRPDFVASLQKLLGKTFDIATLNEVARRAVAVFRAHGHPFVDVSIPPQNIDSGVVQVMVREFRLGRITVQGNRWFGADVIRAGMGLRPGSAIDAARVSAGLDRLNAGGFHDVTAVWQPGQQTGTTDLLLKTQDHFPVRLSAQYDNSGTEATGLDRWTLGADWGNAAWRGDTLSFQFVTSGDYWHQRGSVDGQERPASSITYIGSYEAWLPWGDSVTVFGNYAVQSPLLGPSLGEIGVSSQASLRYGIPLPPLLGATDSVSLGYDYKVTNNNLSFGGTAVSSTSSEIDQFLLDANASLPDTYGNTALENVSVGSPGGLTPLNRTSYFQPGTTPSGGNQAGTPGATANYIYDRLTLTRLTRLPRGFGAVSRVTGQVADHTLLPSEQLIVGGIDTVRGYLNQTAGGTDGIVLNQEFRTPPFSPIQALDGPDLGDALQFDTFWDYAAVSQKSVAAGDPRGAHLESLGVGMRYALGDRLSVRMEYGWQLIRPPGADQLGSFANIVVYVGL